MTASQIVVSIEVTRDKYLSSNASGQLPQISDGEVVVAWDVDRKDSDSYNTQNYLGPVSLRYDIITLWLLNLPFNLR